MLLGCARTVSGGDSYDAATILFDNNEIVITPDGTMAAPVKIEVLTKAEFNLQSALAVSSSILLPSLISLSYLLFPLRNLGPFVPSLVSYPYSLFVRSFLSVSLLTSTLI